VARGADQAGVVGHQLVQQVVAHRAEEPAGQVVGALVVAADYERKLPPFAPIQPQVFGRHGAVGAVGEEDEAVLVELPLGLEALEAPRPRS